MESILLHIMDLLKSLSPDLYYHSKYHTLEEVVPIAVELAEEKGLPTETVQLIKIAALFHDIGFLKQYKKNELIGVEMAKEFLSKVNLSQEQIDKVCELIMATEMPQRPLSVEAQVLCDADLCNLGMETFFIRSNQLRQELEVKGEIYTDLQWLERSIKFLESHKYHTEEARKRFHTLKEKHIKEMKLQLSKL